MKQNITKLDTMKIKERYITVIDNRQVEKIIYENGQTTIYGSLPSNKVPHRKVKLKK